MKSSTYLNICVNPHNKGMKMDPHSKSKSENHHRGAFIIYIVYHLEVFTLFQRNKKGEAQPRPFYFSEKE